MERFDKYIKDGLEVEFDRELKDYIRELMIGDFHDVNKIVYTVTMCASFVFSVPQDCLITNKKFPSDGLAKIASTFYLSKLIKNNLIAHHTGISPSLVTIRIKTHNDVFSTDKPYRELCQRLALALKDIYPSTEFDR